jgi:NAD(P)-dependent dehydrogenase (short-subunit alcohol dehydrogenase family)
MSLSGRVALITGASQGIGRSMRPEACTKDGAIGRRRGPQSGETTTNSSVKSPPPAARPYALRPRRFSNEEQVKPTVSRQSIAQFGKIDILVNNAGITRDQLVMRMKRADWDAVLHHQSHLRLSLHPAGDPFHAQAALGTHHQHCQRLRPDGPGRAGELRRLESRADRPHHGHRPRTRLAQHYLQRRRSWLHRNRHDCGS